MAKRKKKLKRYHLKRWSSEVLNIGTKMKKGQQSYSNLIGRTMAEKGHGATVLYTSRVKNYTTSNVPKTRPEFLLLSRYELVPDERVPPIIAVMRKREVLTQAPYPNKWTRIVVLNGDMLKLHWFYQGEKSFFMEESAIDGTIKRSCDYPFYKAKVIAKKFYAGLTWPIIWIETHHEVSG